MSNGSGTGTPITNITVAAIRDAINIPEEKELSSDVIESAISRATSYIAVLQARYSAPLEFFTSTEIAYCAYLAYQAYADRVLNVPPGAYHEGKWDPIAEEIVRSTGDKLQGLRQAAMDLIDIIKSYPVRPMGTFHHFTPPAQVFSIGQMNYSSYPEI